MHRIAVSRKNDPEESKPSKGGFLGLSILGMLRCASSNAPSGAYRNGYKYLMAMIERLFFSTEREWRKFLTIIDVRE
jgi:hypothetical protein